MVVVEVGGGRIKKSEAGREQLRRAVRDFRAKLFKRAGWREGGLLIILVFTATCGLRQRKLICGGGSALGFVGLSSLRSQSGAARIPEKLSLFSILPPLSCLFRLPLARVVGVPGFRGLRPSKLSASTGTCPTKPSLNPCQMQPLMPPDFGIFPLAHS